MSVRGNPSEFEKALLSMLRQNYACLEVLVVLDQAHEEVLAVLNKYDCSKLRVIENNSPLNLSRSLNLGVKKAKGDWIARLDADDIAANNRVQRQVEVILTSESDTVVVCSNAENLVPHSNSREISELQIQEFLKSNPIIHPTTLIKKSFLLENPYDEKFRYSQDYELWTRAIRLGRIKHIPENLIKFDSRKRDGKYVLSQESYFLRANCKFVMSLLFSKSRNPSKLELLRAIVRLALRFLNWIWNNIRMLLGRFD
jgi:glycosyltransferase involved in cell wall biosynthesis